jgi:hypothetical protein
VANIDTPGVRLRPCAADPERLEDVCWLGDATWSHTSLTPRWRVVVPLAESVSAEQWRDVWLGPVRRCAPRRTHPASSALCPRGGPILHVRRCAPEADPSCKDASRRYYVPSYASAALHQATHHPAWRHARRQHVARLTSRASAVAAQEACPCEW